MRSCFKPVSILTACAALLVGCGGGGNNPAPPPTALAAADAYTLDWNAAKRLSVQDNDTSTGGALVLSVTEPPKNGTVTVDGTALVYTPNPGFFGDDTLIYQLVSTNVDKVSVKSGAAVALKVEAALTLQGVVSDGPIANAKVVATLGTQTFSTDADAQGRYSLPVKTSRPADFLSLVAAGVGSQSAVVLSSLVGEIAGLAAQAKNSQLNSDTTPALQVSHLTAAMTGLLAQAGALPATDAALAEAMQKLNTEDMLDAAALVKLVVDGGVALPEGISSTQALLASATTLSSFARAQRAANGAAFDTTRAGIGLDATLQRAPPAPMGASAPAETWVYAIGQGGAASIATHITLRADGSATVVDSSAHAATWTRVGNLLQLVYAQPAINRSVSSQVDAGGLQWGIDYVTTGLTLTDLGARNSRYTAATLGSEGYQLDHGGPQAEIKQVFPKGARVLRRYDVAKLAAFKPEDMTAGKRWAGLYSAHDLRTFNNFKQDVLAVTGSDSALMERAQLAATWRLADGALEVTLPGFNYRYRRLGLGGLGEERWLMEQRVAGELLGVREIMAVPAVEVNIDATQLAHRWLSNINAASRFGSIFSLRADGMAALTLVSIDQPESTATFNRSWRVLLNGQVEMVSGRRVGTNTACKFTPSDATCLASQTRYWRFVARTGTTLFTIEQGPYSGTVSEADMSYRFVAFSDLGEVK